MKDSAELLADLGAYRVGEIAVLTETMRIVLQPLRAGDLSLLIRLEGLGAFRDEAIAAAPLLRGRLDPAGMLSFEVAKHARRAELKTYPELLLWNTADPDRARFRAVAEMITVRRGRPGGWDELS